MITADMFAPLVDAAKQFVPIALGAGVSVYVVTWGAKKGFNFVKSMVK
ncbi:hypothetical protein WMI_01336 [Enterococcus faecalis EnGen0363]|nr:hypothetical protein [Enterococcus faecalis]EJI7258984.1 hypothetical protein [Enterococcus faecalis]EOJ56140.1 hypothetical protein WMI_01336 [Enterococcus faecalis EnGen0363]NSM73095.1 hypothetical protein [Enterococcus faecalis]NSM80889.1 hypothetical protein [Enterococcus faecalis]HCW2815942.1 hypothetical protein [Enterococcus faecalis]